MVGFWYSLGTVKPSITEWVNFPSINGNLNLFQIRKVDFPQVKVGKIYLRTTQGNIVDEKWEIIYPKSQFEIFIIPNSFPDLSKPRIIQVLKDSKSKTWSFEFSLEILVYSQQFNTSISNEITDQLTSFDQAIQELSDRIDLLPSKISQTSSNTLGTAENKNNLMATLLGFI